MNQNNDLKIAELFIHHAGQSARVCRLFKFIPENTNLQFFGFIEIETPRFRAEKIAAIIINSLENFYKNAVATGKFFDVAIFERSLHFFNKQLIELLNQEKILFNSKYFNILLGALHNHEVYFSKHGEVGMLMFRKIGDKIQMINLETKFAEDSGSPKLPTKILSQLLQGTLKDADLVLFSNFYLDQIVDPKILAQVARIEIGGVLRDLKSILLDNRNDKTCAIIAIGSGTASRRADTPITPKTKLDGAITSTKKRAPKTLASNASKNKKIVVDFRKLFRNTSIAFSKLLITMMRSLGWSLKYLFIVSVNWRGQRITKINNLRNAITNYLNKNILKFNGLSKKSKIGLTLASLIIFIVIQHLLIQVSGAVRNNKEKFFAHEVASLETKLAEAEGYIIYKDFARARPIIEEVKSVLLSWPREGLTLQATKNLATNLDRLWKNAWQVESVALEIITEIPKSKKEYLLQDLIMRSDELVIIGDNEIYNFNLTSQKIKVIPKPFNLNKISAAKIDEENKAILLSLADQNFSSLDEGGSWNMVTIAERPNDLLDFIPFGNKLYILNTESIYKYQRSIDGYSQKEAWTSNSLPQNPRTIAIDGAIYVGGETGEITKFFGGKRDNIIFEKLNKEFGGARIWTSESSKFLYSLSPDSGQLAVYNKKNGSLLKQYLFTGIREIKAYSIDEQSGIGYLVSENKLYGFSLSHLKKK